MRLTKEKQIQKWIDEVNNALFELEESFTVTASKTVDLRLKTCSAEKNTYSLSKQQHLLRKQKINQQSGEFPAPHPYPKPKICRELINLEPTCIRETRLRKRPLPKPAGISFSAQRVQAREQEARRGGRQTSPRETRRAATLSLASRKRKTTSSASVNDDSVAGHDTHEERHRLKSSTPSTFTSRRQLQRLEHAKPRVKFVAFAMHNKTDFVAEMRRQLAGVQNQPISKQLRESIHEKYPLEFTFTKRAESPAAPEDSDEDSRFFATVTAAYDMAAEAYTRHEDEEEWKMWLRQFSTA
ncbi:hypothetical protein EMCG_07927 [[Emmonsia] crescens]|uniref:Uncharacterized protein n=1 Tax=[Emmonsia] crescens TaxID=73230 RepID=A0A0G2JAU2_9EURO|nr:hypothetical protein EMCG_07927 [Emmonsia crescens UAMH 3008]